MTIKDIIVKYSKELEEISPTPRLDVETLLQKVLGVDRLYILLIYITICYNTFVSMVNH